VGWVEKGWIGGEGLMGDMCVWVGSVGRGVWGMGGMDGMRRWVG
jgi:hypothetical protein